MIMKRRMMRMNIIMTTFNTITEMIFNQIMDNKDLMGQIYSFDRTYHDKYKEVINEFKLRVRIPDMKRELDGLYTAVEFLDYHSSRIAETRLKSVRGEYNHSRGRGMYFQHYLKYHLDCLETLYHNHKLFLHVFWKSLKNHTPFNNFLVYDRTHNTYHYRNTGWISHSPDLQCMWRFYYPSGVNKMQLRTITNNIKF